MARLISFRTSKFDISKEPPNPINPIAGQSVLTWLKETLAGSGYTLSEPDAEDWGWYMDVHADGQAYLIGALARAQSLLRAPWTLIGSYSSARTGRLWTSY